MEVVWWLLDSLNMVYNMQHSGGIQLHVQSFELDFL